jgi:hypothetical protein
MKKLLFITILILSSCSKPNRWYNLELKDQNSEIKFPEKPTNRLDKTVVKGFELPVNLFIYQDEKKGAQNVAYMLATTIYPDSIANLFPNEKGSILDLTCRSVINSSEMKLISQKKIKLNKIEGRELKLDYLDGEFIMTYKFYLHKENMYVMNTITDPKNDLNAEQNKFFDSFKIFE